MYPETVSRVSRDKVTFTIRTYGQCEWVQDQNKLWGSNQKTIEDNNIDIQKCMYVDTGFGTLIQYGYNVWPGEACEHD